MKAFKFSSSNDSMLVFTGREFYSIYKKAEFLRNSQNIETILAMGYELRRKLKSVEPGENIEIAGMLLARNTPLLVKKTGPNTKVEIYEFTTNRLTGLTAAYAFDNRQRFPVIKSSEAAALGLIWDNTNEEKCRMYLSAVTGTEHFVDQFSFVPLICAIRKFQLKKMTIELVLKMAKIKNNDGVQMATLIRSNFVLVTRLWGYFPGADPADLLALLETAPPQLKQLFKP